MKKLNFWLPSHKIKRNDQNKNENINHVPACSNPQIDMKKKSKNIKVQFSTD